MRPGETPPLLEVRDLRVSFREQGTQIRAGAAVFNHKEDIGRFLEAAEELRTL